MSDTVFSTPETMISVGAKYSQKAQDVLSLHSTLDAFSQTLHDSLPNEKAQYAMDQFWTTWSANMLNMAANCEAIGILLVKAAVAYLKSDEAIAKAFHGDKAEQDKINAEIDQANKQIDQFKQKYDQEVKADAAVHKSLDNEKKDLTLHNGQVRGEISEEDDAGDAPMHDVTFMVDKDGKITVVYTYHPLYVEIWGAHYDDSQTKTSSRSVSAIYFNGHWVQAGSDEAKAIHNNTAGGTTSKDPMLQADYTGIGEEQGQ